MARLLVYETPDGDRPFSTWFASLDETTSNRVADGLGRLEHGNPGDIKGVGGGVIERRFHFGPGYRVYYGRDGESLIVLLGGGSKRRQAADIARAKRPWDAYLAEKRTPELGGPATPRKSEGNDATGR